VVSKENGKLLFKVYLKPEYQGKPVPLTDQKGNPLASAIKGGSGVIHYLWPAPNSSNLVAKTMWYEYVPDLHWYITLATYDYQLYAQIKSTAIFITLAFAISAGGLLVLIFILLKAIVTSKLKDLPKTMEKFAEGDLTINIPQYKSKDEISLILKAINVAVKGIENLIISLKEKGQDLLNSNDKVLDSIKITEEIAESVKNSSSQITSDVQNISANIEEVNAGQEEFAAGVQRIADETNTMAEATKTVVDKLSKVSEASDNALRLTNELGENADKTLESVNEMTEKVNLITEFAQSISSISEQTNLLALNAAIEAARAGESGKGFAVIADEIRELANESKITAEKISNSISEIRSVSNVASAEVEKTNQNINDTIENITNLITDVKDVDEKMNGVSGSINSISSSVEESNATAEELASAVTNIASLFESIVSKVEEVDEEIAKQEGAVGNLADAANTLQEVVASLNKSISAFKLKD
jgi:methyl-accepting chemotaxis protein